MSDDDLLSDESTARAWEGPRETIRDALLAEIHEWKMAASAEAGHARELRAELAEARKENERLRAVIREWAQDGHLPPPYEVEAALATRPTGGADE